MNGSDRAIGALLGLAVGDAVGTTLEFRAPGTFTPIDDMVGGGPFRLAAGEWTDDTSMALCLAESILDTGAMDLGDQLRRYLLWRDGGYLSSNGRCFDIGITTRSQLDRFRRTGQPVDPQPDDDAAANGSLMRLSAAPIRWHADPSTAATRSAESSRSTHAAKRSVDSCRLMGAIVGALINGSTFDDVTAASFWQWGELHPEVQDIASGSWKHKQPPSIRGTGYCIQALEAALWAVAGAGDFRSAVLRAANLGDDADTTAAIAGQIAGARWGASRARAAACRRVPRGSPASRARQKVDLLVDVGIRTFVDLTTPADPLDEPIVRSVAAARNLDVRHMSFPVPDRGVVDDGRYDDVTSTIEQALTRGGVFVHCWGGVGRTATVIGCLLADEGLDYDQIVSRLAALRQGSRKAHRPAPETPSQHELIRRRVASRR